jgi:hypothetical protein
MTTPSVTYATFTTGTAADAGAVNVNFKDVVNCLKDGKKDLVVNDVTSPTIVASGVSITSEFAGSRALFSWGPWSSETIDDFPAGYAETAGLPTDQDPFDMVGTTYDYSRLVMSRSGSVVGVYVHYELESHATVTSGTSTPTMRWRIRKNAASLTTTEIYSFSTVGTYTNWTTYNRGVKSFATGDYLDLYHRVDYGGSPLSSISEATASFSFHFEVVYDT